MTESRTGILDELSYFEWVYVLSGEIDFFFWFRIVIRNDGK